MQTVQPCGCAVLIMNRFSVLDVFGDCFLFLWCRIFDKSNAAVSTPIFHSFLAGADNRGIKWFLIKCHLFAGT